MRHETADMDVSGSVPGDGINLNRASSCNGSTTAEHDDIMVHWTVWNEYLVWQLF